MNKLFSYPKISLLLLFSFFIFNNYCYAEIVAMSNDDLETVTGTGISVETTPTGKVDFAFDAETKDGTPISGTGTLEVLKKEEAVNASTDTSTLSLNDSAQENLRALVNVNAVNSAIQVLLNLNVNINSIVGEVNQASQAQLN